MEKKKRATYEVLIVVVVVGLCLVLGLGLYAKRVKVAKGKLLIQELGALRASITQYRILNQKYPASLEDLAKSTFDTGKGKRLYVEKVQKNSNGKLVDPFGTQYRYDLAKGWVSSTSSGYEKW